MLVENTLAGFARAYGRGFRYFETDVHATSDGVLVACHDPTLRRVAGERQRIEALTWDEIAAIPVGGAPLPRLVELLEAFPEVRFNIDPKSDASVRPLVDALRHGDLLERTCVASFSDERLRWIRAALGSQVCTAAGPRELWQATRAAARGRPIELPGVQVLQVPRLMLRTLPTRRGERVSLLTAAQRVDLPVHVWTVNDAAEIQRHLDSGVDGVMSDDVDALSTVFEAHGWRPAA